MFKRIDAGDTLACLAACLAFRSATDRITWGQGFGIFLTVFLALVLVDFIRRSTKP